MRIPALEFRSKHYPAAFNGRVPKRVRMLTTVVSEMPHRQRLWAYEGEIYEAWTNYHGAVNVVVSGDGMLGVKPHEFEVVEWF